MAISPKIQIQEGHPFHRGANWDGNGTNFALFSANATKVEVCIFDDDGKRELHRTTLPEHTNQILETFTASEFMARTSPKQATASTRTSCFSIPMRWVTSESFSGILRSSATTWSRWMT